MGKGVMRMGEEELRGVIGETIIRLYYLRKNLFSKKRENFFLKKILLLVRD